MFDSDRPFFLKSGLKNLQLFFLDSFDSFCILVRPRKRPQPAKMKNEGTGDSDDERKAEQCPTYFD